ncbi:MAG: hypothetical protein H6Q70_283 [Firmicutes bacterium]|nr:hypothetical protein [Bacillota bacterium]
MQDDEGGYINWYQYRLVKSCGQGSTAACGGEPSSPRPRGEVRSIYKGQDLFSWEIEVLEMYRIYKTTDDIIMAEEVDSADITVKLMTDFDKKKYVMVKQQEEVMIYNLSQFGLLTEIADDIPFEEYRDIIYARLDRELLELGIKPKRLEYRKFDWKHIIDKGSTSSS